MFIWLQGSGYVAEVKIKGGSERTLKKILADPKVDKVTLGPTSGRLYWYDRKGKLIDYGEFEYKEVLALENR